MALGVITSDSITRESDLTDGFELLPLSLVQEDGRSASWSVPMKAGIPKILSASPTQAIDIRRSAQELIELYLEMAREQKS